MRTEFDSPNDRRVNRRKFLLGALFGGAAIAAYVRAPHTKIDLLGPHKLENLIPKSIGPWNFVAASGLVVPPEDQLAKAIYSQLLTRVYWDGQNSPIMLPSVTYASSGWASP